MERNKQFIITYSKEEKQQLIDMLVSKGFRNTDGITMEEPATNHVQAFCADVKSRSFGYTNATCCAIWAQAKRPFYRLKDCAEVLPDLN